jgi:hypothetical protein
MPPKKRKQNADLKTLELMQTDAVAVVRDIFGSTLWDHQEQILTAVRDHPKVAWRSSHGIGKTYVCARLVLWWLFSFPYSIVITTAPTWRQVEDLLWKEIRSCYYNSAFDLGGHLSPSATQLAIDGKEWVAIGLSTNDSNRFQGYHSEHLLVVVDEAAGVAEEIFEAIMGVLTSAHCRLILIGNPTDIGGQFYRAFRTEGWKTGKTAAWDTPNFKELGITREDIINNTWEAKVPRKDNGDFDWPYPWLITPKWAHDAFLEWGTSHPAWFARVEGEFPEQGEYNVIPLGWIEQAQDRWPDVVPDRKEPIVLGVDVARGGMDLSAIAVRQGAKILSIETFSNMDGPLLAGEIAVRYRRLKASRANIDIIGLGAAVEDALKDPVYHDITVVPVNVATSSDVLDSDGNRKYQNLRAELWWTLREALDPKTKDPLALPPGDSLLGDLAAPKYDFRKGWIQVEAKEETKKRLGRSPDEGDAVMLTFAPKTTSTVLTFSTQPIARPYQINSF